MIFSNLKKDMILKLNKEIRKLACQSGRAGKNTSKQGF